MKISAFPMVKAACCFMMGMLTFPIFSCHDWLIPISITVLYCALEFMPATMRWHGWAVQLSLYLLSFIMGNYFYTSHFNATQLSVLPEVHDRYLGRFDQKPILKSYHIEAKLSITRNSSSTTDLRAKVTHVLAKFSLADSLILNFHKGDKMIFEGCPVDIPLQKNPQRFQRKHHLFYQGLVQQIRINEGCWTKLNFGDNYRITDKLEQIRRNFSKELDNKIKEPRNRAIVQALLLGIRDGMPVEVLQTFSNTGAIHVLAVSGLHVGAVLFFFVWLMKRLIKRDNSYKWVPLIILIPLALSYMIITGFSSSVIRSVIMFSTVLLGKTWFKNANTVNLLFVCAIWMLLYNPFYIHDLSFQFSFLSLGGILIIQPELKKWWAPKHYITRYIWELTSVSIAAQIFVFPISIYYFHQFPIYFIPAGLLAIPLAILLVYGGLLLPVIIYSDLFFHDFFIDLYTSIVKFLDSSMQFIEAWPGAVWRHIYFDFWDVTGLYVAIACLLHFITIKSKDTFYMAVIIMLVLMGKFMIRDINQNKQIKFCFYATPRGHLVDVFYGKFALVLKSNHLDLSTEKHNSEFNRISHGIQNIIYADDFQSIKAQDFKFSRGVGQIDKMYWSENFNTFLKMKDVITFSMVFINRDDFHIPKNQINFPPKLLVVLAGDLYKKKKDGWIKYLQENKIVFVDTSSQGYFEWDIKGKRYY